MDFLCQKMTLLFEVDATINLIKGCFLAKYKSGALLNLLNISQYNLIQIFINQVALR